LPSGAGSRVTGNPSCPGIVFSGIVFRGIYFFGSRGSLIKPQVRLAVLRILTMTSKTCRRKNRSNIAIETNFGIRLLSFNPQSQWKTS
jgi:hypothetical protein